MSFDRSVHAWCSNLRERHAKLNRAARFCAHQLIFLVCLAAAILCLVFFGDHWFVSVWRGFSALAIAWACCITVELVIGRRRPFQAFHVRTLGKYWTPNPSFPSVHATLAFALAMFSFLLFGAPLGAAFFVVAVLIGISRVYVGVHYFSDVAAGAILGTAVSWGVFWALGFRL